MIIIFFKDCVTKLSILDIMEGPGNFRHQIIHLHSVLTSPRDLCYFLPFSVRTRESGSGSVRPGSALCAARPGRGPHTAAAAGCREGALRQLCLLKTVLQVEQDHGTPTSVLCHFVCVFLKRRKHKTLLTICQFQKTGS